MAGYTRQSIADIINGAEITAPPLNAEFNQLSAAFNGSTGHSHDGTSGNAPKIDLTTSVSNYLPAVNGGVGGRNNVTATTVPTSSNDGTQGYAPGSLWSNTTTGRFYICVGNATGAAIWRELVQVQGGNAIIPVAHDTIDLGTITTRFQDLYLSGGISASGNIAIGGTSTFTGAVTASSTLNVVGLSTHANVDINGGNIDATTIGASTPAAATFTTAQTTGLATFASVDINGGNIDGTVIGGTAPSTGAFTTATISTANISSADLDSGVIDNTTIGATTPAAGSFTTLSASTSLTAATADINGGTIDGAAVGSAVPSTGAFTTLSASGTSTLATVDINGGAIDGTVIGGTSRAAGSFTTVSTTGQATLASADINGGTIDGATIGTTVPAAGAFTTLSASGGVTGDVTGNVTGNLTGNVTGDVTGNVTGNLTGNVTAATGTSSFNNVTINGTLNMDAATAATIINLTDPTNAQDAATKNYVDTKDALKLNLTGGTMSGNIAMGGNTVTGLAAPTSASDAATKGYVDAEVAALVDAAPGTLDTLNELAAALGDDPNFSTTITNSIATKLPLAGGNMTGAIDMGANKITSVADPTLAQDAATKAYVDAADALKLDLAGGTMGGDIAMAANSITGLADPLTAQDAATKAYVDAQDALQVSKSGDSMSGNLDMGGNAVLGVATPVNTGDAANKSYVDGLFQSTVAASVSAANAATSEANAATSEANAATSETNAAASAAAAAASYDSFDDRYLGAKATAPTTDNDGDPLQIGALYFNTTQEFMYVYGTGGWVLAGSSVNGTSNRYFYTATAGQTTFSAVYDTGYVDVYLNGVKLSPTDYTATNGTTVVLAVGAAAGDLVEIIGFGSFVLADHYTKTQSDAAYVSVTGDTMTGDLTVPNLITAGQVDGRDVSVDGAKLDGIEAGATADQTGAEIKALYEAEADTNAFTDAEKTKLSGIEAGATGDQTAAEILAALVTVDGAGSTLDADTLDGKQLSTIESEYQAYATAAAAALVDAAPAALDTLNELAAALGDDPNFATTITNSIATKVAKSGDTMTGNLTLPTLNATTVSLGTWTITESAGVLYFAVSGVNKAKLDGSGNFTVVGDVTAFGTV